MKSSVKIDQLEPLIINVSSLGIQWMRTTLIAFKQLSVAAIYINLVLK